MAPYLAEDLRLLNLELIFLWTLERTTQGEKDYLLLFLVKRDSKLLTIKMKHRQLQLKLKILLTNFYKCMR